MGQNRKETNKAETWLKRQLRRFRAPSYRLMTQFCTSPHFFFPSLVLGIESGALLSLGKQSY